MHKPYKDLTDEQKRLVSVMYSDLGTVQEFEYNFEGIHYRGRRKAEPVKDAARFYSEVYFTDEEAEKLKKAVEEETPAEEPAKPKRKPRAAKK